MALQPQDAGAAPAPRKEPAENPEAPDAILAEILIVDDNEVNRDMLGRRLKRLGHQITTADSGEAALEMIAGREFDLVLLDVMMPGIDGFETLERIRKAHSRTDLPVIMATAREHRDDVIRALKAGANDYVIKPLDFEVVLARVATQITVKKSVDRVLKLERALKRRADELAAINERMKSDLESAGALQKRLLPAQLPTLPGIRFAWAFEPCDELAGDILNISPLDADHVGFYMLDVAGHGVQASLLSVTLSRMLNPVAGHDCIVLSRAPGLPDRPTPPDDVGAALSQRFQMGVNTEQYFTLAYFVLEAPARRVRYITAGHPGPFYVSELGEVKDLSRSSFPIGWMPDKRYEPAALDMTPGSRLWLLSDGLLEADNPKRERFGLPRTFDLLKAVRELPLAEALAEVIEHVRAWTGRGYSDDVSAVVIEIDR